MVYDAYFSKPISGLDNERDYKCPHTYAGPALIAFGDFWGLNSALLVIPNLESNKDYAWIDLISIMSKNGQDILDRESIFEKDIFFKGLNLSKETQPLNIFLIIAKSIILLEQNHLTQRQLKALYSSRFLSIQKTPVISMRNLILL